MSAGSAAPDAPGAPASRPASGRPEPLVGREAELIALASLTARAAAGEGGWLVLGGRTGAGKSRLLAAAVRQAEQVDGLRVLAAPAGGPPSGCPLLARLLAPLAGEEPGGALPARQEAALRRLLAGEPVEAVGRMPVAVAVLNLLARAAERRPLLVAVDDAHDADDATLEVLAFVGRRLSSTGVALLLAVDPRRLGAPHAAGLPMLELGALGPEHALVLLRRLAPDIAPGVAAELRALARCCPMALTELVGALTERERNGSEPLPRPVRVTLRVADAVLEPLAGLPGRTAILMEVLAAGPGSDEATVDAAARLLGSSLADSGPAEDAGVLEAGERRLEFTDPLVRAALYTRLGEARRRAVHAALAAACTGEARAAAGAWHAALALDGPDDAAADRLEGSVPALGRAYGLLFGARARELAGRVTARPGLRARRLLAAAREYWLAGYTERARSLLAEAVEGALDPGVRAAADGLELTLDYASGLAVEDTGPLLRATEAMAPSHQGMAVSFMSMAARVAYCGGDARLLAATADGLDALAGPLAGAAGRLAAALRTLTRTDRIDGEALRSALEAAGTGAAAWSMQWSWPPPELYVLVGEEERSYLGCREAVAALGEAAPVTTRAVALTFAAEHELSLGHWDAAHEHAQAGIDLIEQPEHRPLTARLLVQLAQVHALRGRFEEAERSARRALAISVPLRNALISAMAYWTLGVIDLLAGRSGAALATLRRVVEPGGDAWHPVVAPQAAVSYVRAALDRGEHAAAGAVAERLAGTAGDIGAPWARCMAAVARALVAADSPGPEAAARAEPLFLEALREAERERQRPLIQLTASLAYGVYLHRRRRRGDAQRHLRTASDIAVRLGAVPWQRIIQQYLRAAGGAVDGAAPAAPEALTPREREIARLAAAGLSNRAIGERLFLSPRTVGYHLYRVFPKLGITSRAELHRVDLSDPHE
ncbi:LuxR family transcriptional regulator [Allonocardiopsis opalescens]|uniref:Tetratricopeptide repeat protein n=1 Tax=Allonocardiopsis opalescens TaxID=1144618 RepID=A0A2T0QF95_9ACTN|nr:LuxR family transcriptional regulator [Allonocardiopsis opalescens]PRY02604.1 tetratricopeptide repeat protein [Allonocardiopsis opalescens]